MEARAPLASTLCKLADNPGARVISAVSAQDIDFLKRLGADEAIDYQVSRFEKEV